MPPTGIAARRFYRAFYHWTLLTSTPRIPHVPVRVYRQRTFHTCTVWREAQEQEARTETQSGGADNGQADVGKAQDSGPSSSDAVSSEANPVPGGLEREHHTPQSAIGDSAGSQPLASHGASGEDHIRPDYVSVDQGEQDAESRLRILKQHAWHRDFVSERQRGQRTISFENRTTDSTQARNQKPECNTWEDSPIQSATERPFHTMNKNDVAVRYKSEAGIMLEYAIPEYELKKAQRRHRKDLRHIGMTSGARVELQDISRTLDDAPAGRIHSILISGSFEQANAAFNMLKNFMAKNRTNSASPQRQVSHKNPWRLPVNVHAQPIETEFERPSSTLHPGDIVVRDFDETSNRVSIECAYDEPHIRQLRLKHGEQFERVTGLGGSKVRLLITRSIPDEPSAPAENVFSVVFSGTMRSVSSCYAVVMGITQSRWQNVPGSTREGPVESESQRPSNTLRPWDVVMRQRDEQSARATIETLIPQAHMHGLQAKWGEQLDRLAARTGSTLQFRVITDITKADTCYSVLVSGFFEEVGDGYIRLVAKKGEDVGVQPKTVNSPSSDSKNGTADSGSPSRMKPGSESKKSASHAKQSRSNAPSSEARSERRLHVPPEREDEAPKSAAIEKGNCIVTFRVPGESKDSIIMQNLAGTRARQIWVTSGVEKLEYHRTTKEWVVSGSKEQVERALVQVQQNIDKTCRIHSLPATKIIVLERTDGSQVANGPAAQQTQISAPAASITDIQGDLDPEDAAQLTEDVRTALRALTHPVVLVTANEGGENNMIPLKDCRGVTVSSFNTVTLEPQPIVSFNIKVPSRSWDAIKASNQLRVHLLAATPQGAAIADVFTKPYEHAHEGFVDLEKFGASIQTWQEGIPPRVSQENGVLAHIKAKLLPDRCVEIADHVIVVARVDSCKSVAGPGAKSAGLAYAKQSYRNQGSQLDPNGSPPSEQKPERNWRRSQDSSNDPLQLRPQLTPRSQAAQSRRMPPKHADDKPSWGKYAPPEDDHPRPVNDKVYDVLQATKEAGRTGKPIDLFELWGQSETEGQKGRPNDDQDDLEKTFHEPQSRDSSALWGPEDLAREESGRLSSESRPRAAFNQGALSEDAFSERASPSDALSGLDHAQPTSRRARYRDIMNGKRPYSTVASLCLSQQFATKRSFGTVPTYRKDDSGGDSKFTKVVKPSALKTNVADFLGVPDDNQLWRPHRVRSLVSSGVRRRRWLFQNQFDLLTEEEQQKLEKEVGNDERRMAKKLSWNAAHDLRLMLDKGRVDFTRAQFLEAAIEKGQAVLLEEAKFLRKLYDQGRIDTERFEGLKQNLEAHNDVLMTETNRLRQVVDEEGDEYFSGSLGTTEAPENDVQREEETMARETYHKG